ncbi:ABC transporter substrate-binding protein [Oligoflexus tunisiensis]|uniref:ABC transporter substrate-binding protein n=1 Tax=Oligoflexus tunisiensis TaxID=708132 RepID=UPI00114CBBF9|nr:ABC transporter substrate-binding protein [Oligoflexus tunisiensis]
MLKKVRLNKKTVALSSLAVASLLLAIVVFSERPEGYDMNIVSENSLAVSLPHTWDIPLYPASQRAMIEEAIMTHVFEALVQIGENGLILPLAAKSYKFNDDFTQFEFKIDTSRRFSDGASLTSKDFKRSWEEGLLLPQNSWNKALLDVMAFLSNRKADQGNTADVTLSGIETPDDETLIVRFEKPVRTALAYLSGARFAPFRFVDGRYIGTGRYVIKSQSEAEVLLGLNPYSKELTSFESIRFIAESDPFPRMLNGEIDVIAFNSLNYDKTDLISETKGIEDISYWLHVNGLKGRFFEDRRMRQAFQALIWKIFRENRSEIENSPKRFKVDFQPYLPFQAGRLPDSAFETIARKYETLISELIARSKDNPLELCLKGFLTKVLPFIQESGLNFKNREPEDSLREFYKIHSCDAVLAGASVHVIDSDGLYHLLGKDGAITSPIIYRENVDKLLLEGRIIQTPELLPAHYEKVAEAIFSEVPSIHLGYISNNITYRSDRLRVRQEFIERKYDKIWKIFQPTKPN